MFASGKVILPSRKVILPSRKVNSPSRKVKLPSRKVNLPSRKVNLPPNSHEKPQNTFKKPQTRMKRPKTRLKNPKTHRKTPQTHCFQNPTGCKPQVKNTYLDNAHADLYLVCGSNLDAWIRRWPSLQLSLRQPRRARRMGGPVRVNSGCVRHGPGPLWRVRELEVMPRVP